MQILFLISFFTQNLLNCVEFEHKEDCQFEVEQVFGFIKKHNNDLITRIQINFILCRNDQSIDFQPYVCINEVNYNPSSTDTHSTFKSGEIYKSVYSCTFKINIEKSNFDINEQNYFDWYGKNGEKKINPNLNFKNIFSVDVLKIKFNIFEDNEMVGREIYISVFSTVYGFFYTVENNIMYYLKIKELNRNLLKNRQIYRNDDKISTHKVKSNVLTDKYESLGFVCLLRNLVFHFLAITNINIRCNAGKSISKPETCLFSSHIFDVYLLYCLTKEQAEYEKNKLKAKDI